jgi:hypothetical protein
MELRILPPSSLRSHPSSFIFLDQIESVVESIQCDIEARSKRQPIERQDKRTR